MFSHHEPSERRPNMNSKLIAALNAAYGDKPSPEEIFQYIYAVLYAESYREKYAEFLKIDFPRIPFTADAEVFHEISALGERLISLHLLKSPELDRPAARFEGDGDNRVAKNKNKGFRYDPKETRTYVNMTQYFAPVPLDVWEYRIGGYQVCEKWLKDRKERCLDLEDIRTYCRIVTAIKRTIEITEEIDALYSKVEADLLTIKIESQ